VICNGICRNAGQAACPHPEFRSLFGLLDFITVIPFNHQNGTYDCLLDHIGTGLNTDHL